MTSAESGYSAALGERDGAHTHIAQFITTLTGTGAGIEVAEVKHNFDE